MNKGFSEKTKIEVKEKAAFRCCRCQRIGIHVHHILPKEKGGSNNDDNAAPLCPSCHDYFGDNPKKRKEIKQMRNWWYKQIEKQFPDNKEHLKKLEEINSKIEDVKQNQIGLDDLKDSLRELSDDTINNMTLRTAVVTASGIANTSAASISSTKLGHKVHANMSCHKCGTSIGLLIGTNNCPNCGEIITQ